MTYNQHQNVTEICRSVLQGKEILISTPIPSYSQMETHYRFYYYSLTDQSETKNWINELLNALQKFHKNNIKLNVIALHQPYFNAEILAQYLLANLQKPENVFYYFISDFFRKIQFIQFYIKKSDNKQSLKLPAGVAGLKVQLSGRVSSRNNSRRETVYTLSAGTFHGTHTVIDYGFDTNQSRKGAFTVKV